MNSAEATRSMGMTGVILRDKLRTATLREKIAPLYRIRVVENRS